MSKKNYIWLDEPEFIELWSEPTSEGAPVTVLHSGYVATNQDIALDPNHKVVASWIAFNKIKEAPASKPSVKPAQKETNNA